MAKHNKPSTESEFDQLKLAWAQIDGDQPEIVDEMALVEFMKIFIQYSKQEGQLLLLERFEDTIAITKRLVSIFQHKTRSCITESGGVSLYRFLLSTTGIHLLLSLEILTKRPEHYMNAKKLVPAIVTLVTSILALPPQHLSLRFNPKTRDELEIQFMDYHFLPLERTFSPSALSEDYLALFKVNKLEEYKDDPIQTTPPGNQETHFCSVLCYHLLSILYNMSKDNFALRELIIYSKLKGLFSLLLLETNEHGGRIVQQQLIRVIAKIINEVCKNSNGEGREKKWCDYLIKADFMGPLVTILKSNQILPEIRIEVSELLIYSIKETCVYTDLFFEEFLKLDGYSLMASNLIAIGENGTPSQQRKLVLTICHLFFLPNKRTNSITNIEAIKCFFDALPLASPPFLLNLIFRIIQSIFQFSDKDLQQNLISNFYMFQKLLARFNEYSLNNRKLIIQILTENNSNQLPGEISLNFIGSMGGLDNQYPSNVLLVSQNIFVLISKMKLAKSLLSQYGLMQVLIKFLNFPMEVWPAISAEEIRDSLILLGDRVNAELQTDHEKVAYGCTKQIMELLLSLLTDNNKNLEHFLSQGGLQKVYLLVNDPILRGSALSILATVGIGGDVPNFSAIAVTLITLLNPIISTTFTMAHLDYSKDILACLCIIFENKKMSNNFREKGLDWIGRILDALPKLYQRRNKNDQRFKDAVFSFVQGIIELISFTINSDEYNKNENKAFNANVDKKSLLRCLTDLGYFSEDRYTSGLLDSLLSLSVTSWPPHCPVHLPYHFENSFSTHENTPHIFKHEKRPFDNSLLAVSQSRLDICESCRDSSMIKIPSIIKLILKLLSHACLDIEKERTDTDPPIKIDKKYFISTMKALEILANAHPFNIKLMSDAGILSYIFKHYKPILVKEPTSPSGKVQQTLVMKLVSIIASHRMSLTELREYFAFMDFENSYPLILLQSLVTISSRGNEPPNSCFFPARENSFISCPNVGSHVWPPSKGYTISAWVMINDNSGAIDVFSTSAGTQLTIKDVYLNFSVSETDCVVFDSFKFKPTIWYHIIVTHQSAPSNNVRSNISLFVDGAFIQSQSLFYAPSKPNQMSCCFGVNILKKVEKKQSEGSFSLGNVYLLAQAVTNEEAFLLYYIGPTYVGSLNIKMESLKVYDHVTEKAMVSHVEHIHLLDPVGTSIGYLNEKVLMVFSASKLIYAVHPGNDAPADTGFKGPILIENSANSSPSIVSNNRQGVKDIIGCAGGVNIIIFMIVNAKLPEYQRTALNFLEKILEWNPINTSTISQIKGYGIIARIIRKNWIFDDKLLETLFHFCGLKRSEKDTFSEGIIKNLEAFSHFILDWTFWKKASLEIQRCVFSSIADLVDPSLPLCTLNIGRLRQIDARTKILQILEEPDMPYELSIYLIIILKRVMHDPWDSDDIDNVFNYLIATHTETDSKNISIGQAPSMGSLLQQESSQPINAIPIRNLVLSYLLEQLEAEFPPGKVNALFFTKCSLRVLFSLLETKHDSTRILLLKLLYNFLRTNENFQQFKREQGFYLLGIHLKNHPLTENSMATLLAMMFGNLELHSKLGGDSSPNDGKNNGEFHLSIQSYHELNHSMKYPEALISILLSLTNKMLDKSVKHSVIKILHDVYIHNENAKKEFVKLKIVELLCNILVDELDLKEVDCLGYVDESWTIEEDILRFIRSINLHSCTSNFELTEMKNILVTIHIRPLPAEYLCILQYRVLYDILSFYSENNFTDDLQLELFERITSFSCMHFVLLNSFLDRENQRKYSETVPIQDSRESSPSPLVNENQNNGSSSNFESAPSPQLSTSNPPRPSPSPQLSVSNPSSSNFINEKRFLWKTNQLLDCKDKALIELIFRVMKQHIQRNSDSSLLFRIAKAMNRKSDLNELKSTFEHFVCHLLKSPIIPLDITKFVLEELVAINIPTFILDEYTFTSKILWYTKDKLPKQNTISPFEMEVQNAALSLWRKVVSEGKSFLKKIIYCPPGGLQLTHKFVLVEKLPKIVQSIEEVDMEKLTVDRITPELLAQGRQQLEIRWTNLKKLQKEISDMTLEVQQTIMKSLLGIMQKMVEEEKLIRRNWKKLLKSVTHQRAIWPLDSSLLRWELDPIEGPMRMRIRMRAKMAIKHPIVRDLIPTNSTKPVVRNSRDPREIYVGAINLKKLQNHYELYVLFDNSDLGEFLSDSVRNADIIPGENIVEYINCSNITPFHRRDGNILIGEHRLYFIDEHEFQDQEEEKRKITSVRHNFTVDYEYIKEIHNRRYLLKNIALEIFLTTGKTYFLAFMTETDRNKTYEKLLKMELPNLTREAETLLSPSMLSPSITQKWQKGLITNFEYLMILNTLSERTFNDLTQYPVLPFVLADYISEKLNLSEESTFRDLSKPMGAQNPERLERFWEKYRMLETMKEKPYLYGSHYSNMGSVLHFLIRMEPFSRYLIEFQGGKFDVPDRIFFSLAQAWDLSSKTSNSDVKELIPEFFTIPEFLVNDNKFDLGKTQNRKSVSEVELPVWAHNSPRTFIFNHMEALESDYVSSQLHLWIDLIFGSKQRGVEALEASNAFHPLTYEGSVNVEQIQDPLEKAAAIAQINSFGQTPKQIFFKPHPKRFPKESHMKMNIASHPEQIVSRRPLKLSKAIYGLSYVENEIVILGPNRTVFWEKHFKGKPRILQWGNWDGTLRVVSMKDDQVILSLDGLAIQLDTINCADVSQDGTIIACGFKSSLVRLWMKRPRYIKKFQRQQQIKMKQQVEHLKRTSELSAATMKTSGGIPRYDPLDSPRSPSSPSKQKFGGFTQSNNVAKTVIEIEFVGSLDGHQDEVKCIRVCNQHAIAVSGSADGTCIIWDISRRKLLRSLGPHNGPIIALDVEMYWGDIVVVDDPGKEVGNIHLWSINGSPIAQKRLKPRALCVAFTKLKPGLGKNIIITGHSNGEIHLWSAFDLTPLHIIKGTHQFPVCSLAVKEDNMEFTSGDVSGSTITHELRYE